MRWIDILSSSLNNLLRRKLRSALTMLGVVIGSAAIIVTISLGNGAEQTQMRMLETTTNLRLITIYPQFGISADTGNRRITKINDSILREIRAIDHVAAVTPMQYLWGGIGYTLSTGKYETETYLIGVYPKDFAQIAKLKAGTGFSARTDRMEFIMSEYAMLDFRDPKKGYEGIDTWSYLEAGQDLPLPDINWLKTSYDLTLHWETYDEQNKPVTNTQKGKAQMRGYIKADLYDYTFSYGAIVSLDWYKRLYRDNKTLFKELDMPTVTEYDNVLVLADSVDNVVQLVRDLQEFGVSTSSFLNTVELFRSQIRTMQLFMGFIGAISMFVAALSIANTMMMSIYERTREIGVMKVLGCKMGNIRAMFLCEAAYIGIFGGLVGVLLSLGISYALNNVPQLQEVVRSVMSSTTYFSDDGGQTSIITSSLALTTWGFVVLISLVSGISPAQRAMRLSSLAAIRSSD